MRKSPSPFAGVRLSALVSRSSPGPVDQQLFVSSPHPPSPTTAVQREAPQLNKDVKTKRRQDANSSKRQDVKTTFSQGVKASKHQDVETSRLKDVNGSRQQGVGPYDINEETFERETVRVSKAEQRAIDQLKLTLRELLDSTVGKNDIFRAGLHYVLEDFHTNGEQSEIVNRLRKKTP